MIKYRQFEPVIIETREILTEAYTTHSHTYHEFFLIRSGTGKHIFRNQEVSFQKGDLFFIAPGEPHSFVIPRAAKATLIKYSDDLRSLLKTYVNKWDIDGVVMASAKSPLNAFIPLSTEDKVIVTHIFNALEAMKDQTMLNEQLILHQLVSLIVIMERNLTDRRYPNPDKLIVDQMVKHIHKHMKQPLLLTSQHMSALFNIPVTYIGTYFKRHMGQSLKAYINECRMVMIGRMIRKNDVPISVISHDFGFTDESHFLKTFKKFYQMSPTAYKKAALS